MFVWLFSLCDLIHSNMHYEYMNNLMSKAIRFFFLLLLLLFLCNLKITLNFQMFCIFNTFVRYGSVISEFMIGIRIYCNFIWMSLYT